MGDSFVALESALGQFDGAAALTAYEVLRAGGGDRDPRAEAGKVRALWLLRRWDEGRAELAKLGSWCDSVHVELARGFVALGQPDDPMFQAFDYGTALRDPDRALAAFRAASERDPANVEALAGQATALRVSGQVDKAAQLLDNAEMALRMSLVVRVERALCHAERGEIDAALRQSPRPSTSIGLMSEQRSSGSDCCRSVRPHPWTQRHRPMISGGSSRSMPEHSKPMAGP
jgi:tetratricopeptide (TPR) repeat protein